MARSAGFGLRASLALIVQGVLLQSMLWTPVGVHAQVTRNWVATYGSTNEDRFPYRGTDTAVAVTLDQKGDIYVVGQLEELGHSGRKDCMTIKYSSEGKVLWAQSYDNDRGETDDRPLAVAVDGTGRCYVAGTSYGGVHHIFIIQYDTDGVEQWVARYSFARDTDVMGAMTLDESGNIYVAGRSVGAGTIAYVTMKYSPTGQRLWVQRHKANEAPNGEQDVKSSILDRNGDLVVSASADCFKYSPDGKLIWSKSRIPVGSDGAPHLTLGIDPKNNIVLPEGLLSPDGIAIWRTDFSRPPFDRLSAHVTALSVDSEGNHLLIGFQYWLVKRSSSGRILWKSRSPLDGYVSALFVNGRGDAYVATYVAKLIPTAPSLALAKYDSRGNRLWTTRYDGRPESVAGNAEGSLVVVGDTAQFYPAENISTPDMVTIAYAENQIAGYPEIITGPTDEAIRLGTKMKLSATASGNPPLEYQWLFDGKPISRATNSVFQIEATKESDDGDYAVQVRNSVGTVVSPDARILVGIPPAITAEPVDGKVDIGSTTSFRVEATGSQPMEFKWYHQTALISSLDLGSELVLTNVQNSTVGEYFVIVSNAFGVVTSSVVQLTVVARPPEILVQPVSLACLPSSGAKFYIQATGPLPIRVQWFRNGQPITGLLSPERVALNDPIPVQHSLAVNSVSALDLGEYFVVASNSYGVTTSAVARLAIEERLSDATEAVGFVWRGLAGQGAFTYQTNVTHDGIDAAGAVTRKVGPGPYQAAMTARLKGPGDLQFWWRASSGAVREFSSVDDSGRVLARIQKPATLGGSWELAKISLPQGLQTVSWTTYNNWPSFFGINDTTVWIDEISFLSRSAEVPTISKFSITQGMASILFNTINGVFYQVEKARSIEGPWLQTGELIVGDAYPKTSTDPVSREGQVFYRVRIKSAAK